jgi:hypothetical protein
MRAFEYRHAEETRDAFARHGVRCLFIGKSGAMPLRSFREFWLERRR